MKNKDSKPKKIAIQGGYGAFHEIAANGIFTMMKLRSFPEHP
jgi:hypothetical protein